MKYRKEENGSFAHSNVIFLINPEGEIVHRQVGLGTDPNTMQQAVVTLLSSMASDE